MKRAKVLCTLLLCIIQSIGFGIYATTYNLTFAVYGGEGGTITLLHNVDGSSRGYTTVNNITNSTIGIYECTKSMSYTAVPAEGYEFDHWSWTYNVNTGASGQVNLKEATSETNPKGSTQMGSSGGSSVIWPNTTVYAHFRRVAATTYTVTWKSEDGTTTLETDADVAENDASSFDKSAPTKPSTAEYEYTFDGWATEANGDKVYNIGATPVVTEDATYYAHFSASKRSYTITVTSNGNGTVTGGGTYEYGTSASLTATPNDYYQFDSWSDDGVQNHSVTVTGAATYTASFTLNTSVAINDNEETSYYSTLLSTYNGETINAQLMRTFYAGMWNTVCFPFDLTASQITASDMRTATFYTLSSVTGDAAEGLDFNVSEVTSLSARTPYLVQVSGANIVNPVFEGVTLAASAFTNNTTGTNVGDTRFFGTVHPTSLVVGENSGFLFLGQNNQLYWPNVANDIRAFRAYFYSGNSTVQAVHPRVRLVVRPETPTDVIEGYNADTWSAVVPARKVLDNGNLIIERDGIRYNAVGQVIR
ncbi:MAG: InlB B-repeat-containing protein [Paludibacteraceae bacterium]|nr:InlB B-repeat-containing protein [Paludibacteraceae bacterium]